LIPHQIGIRQELTLISSTSYALEVFTTPITTFEDTPNRQKTIVLIGLQIMNWAEPMEEPGVKLIK